MPRLSYVLPPVLRMKMPELLCLSNGYLQPDVRRLKPVARATGGAGVDLHANASGGGELQRWDSRFMRKRKSQHNQKEQQKKARKLIRPELRGPLLLVALMISVPLLIRFAVHEFIHKRKFPLMDAEWKSYSPGQSGLSLLLPGEPQLGGTDAPAPGTNVKQTDYYQVSVKEFRVVIGSVLYREDVPADLEQATRALPGILQVSGEVAEYKETISRTKHSGRSGVLVTGTFKRNGEPQQVRALLLSEGPRLWQVLVSHQSSYPAATKAARRVIDSIKVTEVRTAL